MPNTSSINTITYEGMKGKFPKQTTRTITAKKKKKYYDKSGNLITYPTLIQDVVSGKTVIRYHEQKSTAKEKRHIVRR